MSNSYTFYAQKPLEKYHKSDIGFLIAVIFLWGLGLFTLFVCRCPIKCHLISFGRDSALGTNSCAWLSPNNRCPALYASTILSLGLNLDTATSLTPAGNDSVICFIFSLIIYKRFFATPSAPLKMTWMEPRITESPHHRITESSSNGYYSYC